MSRTPSRAGFVLPVVILFALVGGLIVAVTITRASQRHTIVRQQLEGYQLSHRQNGVRELVGSWLKYSRDQDFAELTGGEPGEPVPQGGGVFTVDTRRGLVLRVSMQPAQHTARIGVQGLEPQDAQIARRVQAYLRDTLSPDDFRRHTRDFGPVAVDMQSADPAVIRAYANAVFDAPETAELFAAELLDQRGSGPFNPDAIARASAAAVVTGPQRERLSALLIGTVGLWSLAAGWDLKPGVSPDPQAHRGAVGERYVGFVDLTPSLRDGRFSGHASELLLDWQRIAAEPGPGPGYTQNPGASGSSQPARGSR
jgi:hypothetical protein